MRDNDSAYYRLRAREERETARFSEDVTSALIHLRRADAYDRLARGAQLDRIMSVQEALRPAS